MPKHFPLALFLAATLLLAPQATAASDAADLTCGGDLPEGSAPLRRLTFGEYDATIFELLGDDTRPARNFPEEGGSGFDNNAHLQVATRLHAEKYMTAAEAIARRAVGLTVARSGSGRDARGAADVPADPSLRAIKLDRLLGCADFAAAEAGSRPSAAEAACVRAFVRRFGLRAWRRPLARAEASALFAQYRRARADGDLAVGLGRVIATALQSPLFLYRVEVGAAAPGTSLRKLTPHEVATRLSYLLLGTTPDEALLDRATAGDLATRAEVAAEARRMLGDDRARAVVRRFYEQWLDLRLLPELGKEGDVYPTYQRDTPRLLLEEIMRFVDYATWQGDGRFETMLTSPITFLNGPLARFYGVPGVEGSDWIRVTDGAAGPRTRAGILTMGGVQAVHAKRDATHPIKRGLMIREQLLCQIPPPPPDNVNIQLPKASKGLITLRDRLEEHRLDVGCAKCHKLFDPLGLAFEHYDGAGRFRANDNGRPVDASGELLSSDVDGEFKDGLDLISRLAGSAQVRGCFVRQWFRFAYGRTEGKQDACALRELEAAFDAHQHDVRELLVALTQTDLFRWKRSADAESRAPRSARGSDRAATPSVQLASRQVPAGPGAASERAR